MPIALLTDFGTRDPYVAAMRGVIASRTAEPIHDLTHEISPFGVWQAAFFLRDVVEYWPAGTVFVCVVDPGVGTGRRIVAVHADGKTFLAPDNGLLTLIEGETWAITNEALFLRAASTTFHGRDRFATLAAALANGLPFTTLGPRIYDRIRLEYEAPRYDGDRIEGRIISVDHFGNLITDVEADRIVFRRFALQAGGHVIARLERTYGDAAPGPFLIVGSTGRIEISISNGSAAEVLHLGRRDPGSILLKSEG
jgi:S-adenosylmethionine hydrolase